MFSYSKSKERVFTFITTENKCYIPGHFDSSSSSFCNVVVLLTPPSVLDGFNSCSHASAPLDFEMCVFALDDFDDILHSLVQMTMYNNVIEE